ncbi:MAG: hypothetical protein Q8Q06_01355 [bacterium]|nr:hypothetical protein [bacterium]
MNLKSANRQLDNSTALAIADAGIEYYRWHLAHSPGDFQDGTGQPGPYEHEYYDKNGSLIGRFILEITPPTAGSAVVVRSTGKIEKDASIEKIIEAQMAIPSLAQYAVIANDNVQFGPGTEIFGKVHANGGISFNGIAHNIVSSDRQTYNDPDHAGGDEYAIHTHINPSDPLPPSPLPLRPDVFEAGRQLSVPAVDFDGLTGDLAQIKSDAQSAGRYFGSSEDDGYHIVLKTNDTFDLYKVTKVKKPQAGCTVVLGEKDWGTLTIQTEQFIQNYSFPANGLIFVEDHVWVDGHINTARLTIASGKFPENPGQLKNIYINKDVLYTNYDGQDVLALMAQRDVSVGLESEDDLRIDAVLVAKNGRVGRFYYKPQDGNPGCSPYDTRNSIILYGMIATNQRYGFAYSDGTGYQTRSISYDPNLIFAPPPGFPAAAGTHKVISWKEIK